MTKVIVKTKRKNSELLDSVSDAYNEMVGGIDQTIIDWKYTRLLEIINEFNTCLIKMIKLLIDYHVAMDSGMMKFSNDIKEFLANTPTQYDEVIKSGIYTHLFNSCPIIKTVYENIENIKIDDNQFVVMFSFSNFSVKSIFENKQLENLFMIQLGILYKVMKTFADDILFKPNVSAEKMCDIIDAAMEKLKTRLPRCKRAIGIIKKSTDVLKQNFDKYYKDAKIAGNENMFIGFYIDDLLNGDFKNSGRPATLKWEFKEIMKYLYDINKDVIRNHPNINKITEIGIKLLDSWNDHDEPSI